MQPLRSNPIARWATAIGAVVLLGGGIIYWRTTTTLAEPLYGSFSAPSYNSLAQLAANSDLIVEGTVVGVAGREVDFGTADEQERLQTAGVPFVYYEVQVSRTLKGTSDLTVIVGNPDGERIISDDISPLLDGQRVLLFLRAQTSAQDSPGLTLFDSYYTTLGLNAGIYDISSNGDVWPRTAGLQPADGASLTLDDVMREIASE